MAQEGLPLNWFAGTGWTEIPKRLVNYLNENKVQYEILHQPKDWSTQKPWRRDALYYTKVNVVRAGHQHVVTVIPANSHIDLKWFAEVDAPVRLETEEEFKWLFPDCAQAAWVPGYVFGGRHGKEQLGGARRVGPLRAPLPTERCALL